MEKEGEFPLEWDLQRIRNMRYLTPSLFVAPILAGALLAPAAQAAISGVCPDGSIYIVQEEAQIPCSDSKRVEPHEVPPLRPQYLPTPYTWQVWNERHDLREEAGVSS